MGVGVPLTNLTRPRTASARSLYARNGEAGSSAQSKVALAQRMHASGESASTIAATLGVSRATVYGVLAESTDQIG